ncbi:hypothetical protein LWI29_006732 [Acer saccharum]|uniref:Uncharacterized protein n=1 Tax=Acer saccharum TaxID=4024 RepID=A0AA39SRJ0_ACESA|nr:hypothetical protein LWI29_006732 [Acer saccharum]
MMILAQIWFQFGGKLPEWLPQLHNLEVLHPRNNLFPGPIPASVGTLARLSRLDLGRNVLNGTLPDSFRLSVLDIHLDLSSNNLKVFFFKPQPFVNNSVQKTEVGIAPRFGTTNPDSFVNSSAKPPDKLFPDSFLLSKGLCTSPLKEVLDYILLSSHCLKITQAAWNPACQIRLFSARSSTCSELKSERLGGISLENPFDLNFRILRSAKPSPIHNGICPENLLFPRSRLARVDKFWKDNGLFPVSLLSFRCRD